MAGFLTFLAGPIGRWLVIGFITLAFLAGLLHKIKQKGWDERDAIAQKADAARDKAEQESLKRWVKRMEDYSKALDIQLAAAAEKQRALEQKARALQAQLQGSVTTYVPPATDQRIRDCGGIPVGFVRHFNASAAGGEAAAALPPAPEGGEVDRDSGVALSAVAATAAHNHGQFHRCITALKAWEEWYPSVKSIYESQLGPRAPEE